MADKGQSSSQQQNGGHRHHHHRKPDKVESKKKTGHENEPQAAKSASKNKPSEKSEAGERKKHREKKEEKRATVKMPDFLTDRRISKAEMQRRHTWLQMTRISVATARNRFRVTHEVRFPETFNGLYCARFAPKGELLVTTFGTGAIQVRNGETGVLKTTLRSSTETAFPVMCCRFNPVRTDTFYASSACGNIFICTTDTNDFARFIEEPKNEINSIDVSPGGEYIVSGGKDAAVRMYDAELGKIITTWKKSDADLLPEKVSKFHRMRIFAAKFHPSYPELIMTGGWDDTVRIWDIRVADGSIRSIKGPHICGESIDLNVLIDIAALIVILAALAARARPARHLRLLYNVSGLSHEQDTQILTGSWVVRGSLQIWDMNSGKLLETIIPENRPTTLDGEFLYAVQYFDGDPYGETVLAGGSGTGAVEIISLKEKRVMGSSAVNKAVVTVDSCRTSIIYGGMESLLRIADYS